MEFKLKLDSDEYDDQQAFFIGAIIEDVKTKLEVAGIKGEALKDLTGNISFGIATLIDNSSSIEFDGKEIVPVLTFLDGGKELIHCGGNSYTHEYVFGVLDEIFE